MTVRIYRSTDASAPVLTGQTGSLVALLDAILVNGYGSKTAAGWTKPFSTTNKGAYLQNLTGSNNTSGMNLYVDDTGPGAGAAREARVCGFETMSAITPTGTGQFPTSVQSAIGTGMLVIRKSTTADATARAWTAIANGQVIYLFIESGDQTAPLAATTFMFGDFKSFKANDQYAVMIIGRQTENNGTAQADAMHATQLSNGPSMQVLNTTAFGHYAARSWTGLGTSQKIGKLPPNFLHLMYANVINNVGPYQSEAQTSTATTNGQSLAPGRNSSLYPWPAPNAPDGSIPVEPFYLCHSFCKRGYMYGLWQTAMDRPFNHNDTWTDTAGNLNGKSFICQSIPFYYAFTQETCQVYVETSDTWS
jgi:hypothetical protein